MTERVEGRADVTADAARAEAVMVTLGYQPGPHRQVPGPLTKTVVLLLCVVAIMAGIWFGGPSTSRSARQPDSAPAVRSAEPAPGPLGRTGSALEAPPSDVAMARPGDRSLSPEPTEDVEPDDRSARPHGLLLQAEVDRVAVRAGWRLRWDGRDPSWLPGTRVAFESRLDGDLASANGGGLLDDDLLDRLIELKVSDLRAAEGSDDRVGLLGESVSLPEPDITRAAPSAPPVVARSSRVQASRLEPPSPPPPASVDGREGATSPGLFQALRHHDAGEFERARREYLAVIASNDRSVAAHNNLGVLYQEHGYREEAVREFQRAIAIDPNSVKAHNNLGVVWLEAGSWEAAAGEFRAALSARPSNLESLVNLALALDPLGEHAEAIEALHDALALDPRSPEAHYNLALLHERHGDVRLALEHYRSFLEHDGQRHPDLALEVGRRVDRLALAGPRG
jgi:tetratricopeptide (TPR) repeat protein